MPRTLCLSGAGSGAGCGARCALGEFLARGANMIGTQVGVSLHHNRCLPAAGLLDRVEVDPGGHRQAAGERVPEIVEAEVGDPRRRDGRPPVPLEVVRVLPLGRAEHERSQDLALALDRMERLSNDAVRRHPSAVARLVAADAARLLVHVFPLERAQLAQPHSGVEGDGDERAHPRGYGVEKACLLLGAQATIAGVVLSCELDRGHWIVGEPALTDRAVEHRLHELQVVVDRGDSLSIAERGSEVLDLPRRDVDRHPVAEECLEWDSACTIARGGWREPAGTSLNATNQEHPWAVSVLLHELRLQPNRRTYTWSERAVPASSGSNRSSWPEVTASAPTN